MASGYIPSFFETLLRRWGAAIFAWVGLRIVRAYYQPPDLTNFLQNTAAYWLAFSLSILAANIALLGIRSRFPDLGRSMYDPSFFQGIIGPAACGVTMILVSKTGNMLLGSFALFFLLFSLGIFLLLLRHTLRSAIRHSVKK